MLTALENGVIVVNADDTISYRANEGFLGRDTFIYAVFDQDGDRTRHR